MSAAFELDKKKSDAKVGYMPVTFQLHTAFELDKRKSDAKVGWASNAYAWHVTGM